MPTNQHRLRFPPTLPGLEHAASALRELLNARHVDSSPRYNVELAFEEAVSNIVRHGSPIGDVEVVIRFDDDEIVMMLEDDGVPFDPRERPDPVMPTSIDDAPVGGLGLVLLRKILTRMVYERTPQNRNLLTLAIAAR
ncbi:MAG: ATP-binding protein [Vicinamibacterales bacterium]